MSTALDFDEFTRLVASPPEPPRESWRPAFLRVKPGEAERFFAFCREHPLAVVDSIDRQLADLASVRLLKKLLKA